MKQLVLGVSPWLSVAVLCSHGPYSVHAYPWCLFVFLFHKLANKVTIQWFLPIRLVRSLIFFNEREIDRPFTPLPLLCFVCLILNCSWLLQWAWGAFLLDSFPYFYFLVVFIIAVQGISFWCFHICKQRTLILFHPSIILPLLRWLWQIS
jgi:hypothetical protein